MKKLLPLVAVLATGAGTALAVSMPAAADQTPSTPTTSTQTVATGHGAGHHCRAHRALYRAEGTLVSWSMTRDQGGRWSGQLVVHVLRADRHAKASVGTDVTYTVSSARVRIGRAARPPAAGDRVRVLGSITVLPKRCSDASFVSVITIRRIRVAAPKSTGTTTTPTTTTTAS